MKGNGQEPHALPDEEELAKLDPQDSTWTKMYYAAASANSDIAHRLVDYGTYMEEMRAAKRQRAEEA